MNDKKIKLTTAMSVGATASVLFITIMTIVGELVPPSKAWLKEVFTHHWLGKGALAIAIFAVVSILLYSLSKKADQKQMERWLTVLMAVSILGVLVLLLFFIYEFQISHS